MKALTRHLTREARDTLWLLGALLLSTAPHFTHLPVWCSAGVVAALSWRGWLAWQDRALPPRWVLLVALLASIALTWNSHHMLFGREAGVTLVVVLSGLKTLELRARRDAFVVTLLGFFLILTQFMYSQHIMLAGLMLTALWALLTALVLAQRPMGRPPLMEAGKAAFKSLCFGAPLMVVLFVLFPRIGPLWSLPTDAQGRTGLSDNLKLGQVASLALDEGIAMYVRFKGPALPPSALYFRGPVLDEFDGQTWRTSVASQIPVMAERLQALAAPVPYQLTLEANQLRSVPLLEGTTSAQVVGPVQPGNGLSRQGADWSFQAPLQERIQLDAEVAPRFQLQLGENGLDALRIARSLPPGYNPRTVAWARALRASPEMAGANARTLAQAVLRHIRSQNFRYTLTPGDEAEAGAPPSPHHIDTFWISRRSGFCEHFATAFVVVMRAMGIPSRVVTGYQGAERNPVNGIYVVRQSHAHAWAEYWQADVGWTRVDPTAAVAPERIDRSAALRAPATGLQEGLARLNSPLWAQARALWEASNYRWNTWVLQYSRGRQSQLLGQLGWNANDWQDLAQALALSLSGLALLGVGWLWLTRERAPQSPWNPLLKRLELAMQRGGWSALPGWPRPVPAALWLTVLNAPAKKAERRPDQHVVTALARLLRALDETRYGPSGADAPDSDARQMVKTIERMIRAHSRAPDVHTHDDAAR